MYENVQRRRRFAFMILIAYDKSPRKLNVSQAGINEKINHPVRWALATKNITRIENLRNEDGKV